GSAGRRDWRGRGRELEDAVEHAVAVSEGPLPARSDLRAAVRTPRLLTRIAGSPMPGPGVPADGFDRDATARGASRDPDSRSLDDVTRERVTRVLARHGGNATAAARQPGGSRPALWRMRERWGTPR